MRREVATVASAAACGLLVSSAIWTANMFAVPMAAISVAPQLQSPPLSWPPLPQIESGKQPIFSVPQTQAAAFSTSSRVGDKAMLKGIISTGGEPRAVVGTGSSAKSNPYDVVAVGGKFDGLTIVAIDSDGIVVATQNGEQRISLRGDGEQ
jgi:hypothetical protein